MPAQKKLGPLPPGSIIGILGSGQLGRMLAMAAARIGLRCHVYADSAGPAFDVAAQKTVAAYDDEAALAAFAADVQVVTYEFENVPEATARLLAKTVPVRPGQRALAVAQDRLTEKTFLTKLDIPVAPFARIDSARALTKAVAVMDAPAILKTRRLGYDGKGQIGVTPDDDLPAAFAAIGSQPAVLEKRLAFVREISVLVCRPLSGSAVTYDIPHNTHENGILHRSVVPAPIDDATAAAAKAIAIRIADALDYVGLLAVEMFDLGPDAPDGERLLVNEIAPRVHNSGHWTIDACQTSQFENHMRAVAGWPLGTTERHSDAEMRNLIGPEALAWRGLAGEPDACLHLYGKNEAREGRKMGHVTRLLPRNHIPATPPSPRRRTRS
ncbi:MAG TPA: 5-(carboxyamino)imidazole ribonucleotide synthase [Hyphomicrobiaceae bacterium]|nr:5-(carboxyamino)imidazole ribonucleotide synthase [Hyphomicrobiaceae bacterium]